MKIAVVSDTHGFLDKTIEALEMMNGLELILHLGDNVEDAKRIKEKINVETTYIRGNCDYSEYDVEEDKLIEVEGKKIFMTHGHKYDVKSGVNKIFYRGKELNADVVLFGHSHISTMLEYEGILILNPGSPEIPRSGSVGSIGIIEILDGKIKSQIKSL